MKTIEDILHEQVIVELKREVAEAAQPLLEFVSKVDVRRDGVTRLRDNGMWRDDLVIRSTHHNAGGSVPPNSGVADYGTAIHTIIAGLVQILTPRATDVAITEFVKNAQAPKKGGKS